MPFWLAFLQASHCWFSFLLPCFCFYLFRLQSCVLSAYADCCWLVFWLFYVLLPKHFLHQNTCMKKAHVNPYYSSIPFFGTSHKTENDPRLLSENGGRLMFLSFIVPLREYLFLHVHGYRDGPCNIHKSPRTWSSNGIPDSDHRTRYVRRRRSDVWVC